MISTVIFIIVFALSISCILLFLLLSYKGIYKFDLFKLLCIALYILIIYLLYLYNEKDEEINDNFYSINYYLANLSPNFNLTDLNGNTITYP